MWKESLTTLYVHMNVLINYTRMLGIIMRNKFGELREDWKYIISTTCISVNMLLEQVMSVSHHDHIEIYLFPTCLMMSLAEIGDRAQLYYLN